MPAVSLYGDFKLNDKLGLAMFLQAHDLQHKQYAKRLKLPGGDLSGPVNGDWMYAHTMRHVALATQTQHKLESADTKVLGLPDYWRTEQELGDWLDLHNRLHTHIDKVLGIAGHKGVR
jgi:hypothetical protein